MVYRKLACTDFNMFHSDLKDFYSSFEYLSRAKEKLQKNANWEILQTLYEDMSNYYPEAYKLIILDDVEEISEVLRLLNHISTIMTQTKTTPFWKVVVTTQKKPIVLNYPKIGADNFIHVQGFNSQHVNELLQPLQLETEATESIYEALGSSPLAWILFMEQFKSFQVGRQL